MMMITIAFFMIDLKLPKFSVWLLLFSSHSHLFNLVLRAKLPLCSILICGSPWMVFSFVNNLECILFCSYLNYRKIYRFTFLFSIHRSAASPQTKSPGGSSGGVDGDRGGGTSKDNPSVSVVNISWLLSSRFLLAWNSFICMRYFCFLLNRDLKKKGYHIATQTI